MSRYRLLNDEQIEHFVARGYVVLHDCFPRDLAEKWTDRAFTRLGYDRNNAATWIEPRVGMPFHEKLEVKHFAPKAWDAICDLCGGEERIQQPHVWGDNFIGNFGIGKDRPWQPPGPLSPGWHKDGDWFLHFLDSPEQGLLIITVWSDIEHQGGATLLAPDSIAPVAKLLADHPEGIVPQDGPFGKLIEQCNEFVEMTARVGDVVLLHPFMLHAASQNLRGVPRFITNPAVSLREPMNFNRADPEDFSPVELAVLRGLGKERLDFQPTSPRRRIVSQREINQKRMMEQEKARLQGASQP